MKTRRFLAIFLTVLMVLSLFPAAALANTDAVVPEAASVGVEVQSAGTIPPGWGPPSPPPRQKTISHWWPFLSIDVNFDLWNIIGGNFPISITLDCNMFLALTELHATSLITPGGGAGMTMNLTHDIVMPTMAPPAAVPAGATLYIRSSDPNQVRTITNLGFTEHFIVGPGATLILENVILCGGPQSGQGSLLAQHHGGVRVEGRCLLLGLRGIRGGHLIMHQGSAIRNSNAVGNPIFRSRGGGVYLNCGTDTILAPRTGGQLTMLPGSRIHNNTAARGGGVYAGRNAVVRMAEGSRVDNNVARSVGGIVNAYNTGTGGGIHISTNALLEMRGGSIDNNTAVYGGGVRLRGSCMFNRAEFIMNGGEIHSNRAVGSHSILTHPARGGGVRACANSDFTMNAGSIRNNQSASGGGGVSLGFQSLTTPTLFNLGNRGARMNMTGGAIEDNTAVTGGGVRVSAGALLGIVGDWEPRITMTGGAIRNNNAAEGGGVWLQTDTRIELNRTRSGIFGTPTGPTPVIEGNTATRRGGGLFLGAHTDAYLRFGTFRDNTAGVDGGAIFAQKFTYFTPILLPGMYCDMRIVNRSLEFTGNYAGRGAFRPPAVNLRALCLFRYFLNSASVSPTPQNPGGLFTPSNPLNYRLALNNWDVNFIGAPWNQAERPPAMAIAYFLRNDHHQYPYSLHDQDVVTPIPGYLQEPLEEPVWFPRYEGQVRHVFAGWALEEDSDVAVTFPLEVTQDMITTRHVDWVDEPFSYDYINLYAIWEESPRWRLSFIGNGGSPAYDVVWVYDDETYGDAIARWQEQQVDMPEPVDTRVPVREGYEFVAWALNERPGVYHHIGGEMLNFNVVANADHHRWALFAQWVPIDPPPAPIEALFIGNGGFPGETRVTLETVDEYDEPVRLTYQSFIDEWQELTGMIEPTKPGYEFIGWSRSSVSGYWIVAPGSTVSHNIMLFAQWRPITPPMQVTFEGNGGTFVAGAHNRFTVFADEIGTYGAAVNLLAAETEGYTMPWREGYVFQGWFHAPSGGTPVNLSSHLNQNQRTHTLYAQWAPVFGFAVTFHGNGGTPAMMTIDIDDPTATYNTAILQWQYWAGKYVPTREGYTFLGWSRLPYGGVLIDPASRLEAAVTLYAQWQRDRYITVTFDVTGGVPLIDPIVINDLPSTYGAAIGHWQYRAGQETPTRAGYTFRGWFHNPVGGTPVNAGSTLDRDITLYAQWERIVVPVPIMVTFVGNGGTPLNETVAVERDGATYGRAIAQFDYAYGPASRPGYTFLGWSRVSGGAFQLVAPSSSLTENVILFAQWERIGERTVTFLGNGGQPAFTQLTFSLADGNPTYAQAIAAWVYRHGGMTQPVREGYEFLHWASYSTTSPVVGTREINPVNTVLVAQWREIDDGGNGGQPIPTLLTFHGNGGTPAYTVVPITDQYSFAGAIAAWTLQTGVSVPVREGYRFLGWSMLATGGQLVQGAANVVGAFGDNPRVLFAQWERVGVQQPTVEVSFIGNGGLPAFRTVTLLADPVPTFNAAITAWQTATTYEVPTQEGYRFLGWSLVSAPGGGIVPPTGTISGNIQLFAQWEPITTPVPTFDVTFLGNGGQPASTTVTIPVANANYGAAITAWQTETELTVPTRAGYTFLGWSRTAAAGGAIVSSVNGITADITLHAQWEPIVGPQRTITFLGNGGQPASTTVTIPVANANYGVAIAAWQTETQQTAPTRAGYTFLGWSRTAAAGGAIVSPVGAINADITLHAQWEPVPGPQRTITFHGNGGQPALTVVTIPGATITYNAAITAWQAQTDLDEPTRAAHYFLHWSRVSAVDGEPVTGTSNITEDITLYAQWESNSPPSCDECDEYPCICCEECDRHPCICCEVCDTYPCICVTVLFIRNYTGSAAPTEGTVQLGSTVTEPTDPVRTGFVFAGWFLDPDGEDDKDFDAYVEEDMLCEAGNLRIYAQWEALPEEHFHGWFMQGNEYGNFLPYNTITRGEVAAILVRTFAPPSTTQNIGTAIPPATPFADINDLPWAARYVAWAYHHNIIQGSDDPVTGARVFRPLAPISRQELAVMVARAAELAPAAAPVRDFPDANLVADWARTWVNAVTNEGWLRGDGLGNLRPAHDIVRAEAAAIIARALGRDGGVSTDSFADLSAAAIRRFPDVRGRTEAQPTPVWYYYLSIEVSHDHHFILVPVLGTDGEPVVDADGEPVLMERWTRTTIPGR